MDRVLFLINRLPRLVLVYYLAIEAFFMPLTNTKKIDQDVRRKSNYRKNQY